MKKLRTMTKVAMAVALTAMFAGQSFADILSIKVTNNTKNELLAPIVVTSAANDAKFFKGRYVTSAAEHQILTGDPGKIVASIGEGNAAVGHGTDGPPGVLLKSGDSVTFEFETNATALRVLAMVAPTMVPDNYASNVVDIHGMDEVTVTLNRFDIGHNEGTKKVTMVGQNAATVMIVRK